MWIELRFVEERRNGAIDIDKRAEVGHIADNAANNLARSQLL